MELETANLARSGAVDTGWYLSGCMAAGRPIERFPVNVSTFVIGRRPGVSLTVPSPRVSGRHAEILVIGENLLIRDLGSTNGVKVNGQRVAEGTLRPGDELQIGNFRYQVCGDALDGSAEHPPVPTGYDSVPPAPAPD